MACGLDPFWRPGMRTPMTGTPGWRLPNLAARGRPARNRFYCTQPVALGQGMFYAKHMEGCIELPWSFLICMAGVQRSLQLLLKAGLYYADHITAVSPTYAREITGTAVCFGGKEGLLRQRHLEGRCPAYRTARGMRRSGNPESDLPAGVALHARDTPKRRRKTNVSYKLRWVEG